MTGYPASRPQSTRFSSAPQGPLELSHLSGNGNRTSVAGRSQKSQGRPLSNIAESATTVSSSNVAVRRGAQGPMYGGNNDNSTPPAGIVGGTEVIRRDGVSVGGDAEAGGERRKSGGRWSWRRDVAAGNKDKGAEGGGAGVAGDGGASTAKPSSPLGQPAYFDPTAGTGLGAPSSSAPPADPNAPANPNEKPVLCRAEAMFSYTAGTDDPSELSFKKGETLDILDRSGKWWEGRKTLDGQVGIVPSNYLRVF